MYLLGSDYKILISESLREEIRRALETLTPREADVVSSYFGLNGGHAMTLEVIGEKFDLTRERVRQIKEKAVRVSREIPNARSWDNEIQELYEKCKELSPMIKKRTNQ